VGAGGRAAACGLAAGALSLALCGIGLNTRDLSGDEQNMLHLPPAALLAAAVDPAPPFWAHQPLSFLLRALALQLGGEAQPAVWRLHAALACAATAALIAGATAARPGRGAALAGLCAGALCAAHPLLRFYGQDAGNYALSAFLCAALALAALRAAAGRGAGLLGLCSALALMNDLYALPWVIAAQGLALIAALRAPTRVARLRALAPAAAGLALGAASLLPPALRLLADADGQLALHADPPPPHTLPLPAEVAARLGLRAAAALVGGLADGRQRSLEAAGPLVLSAAGLLALGLGSAGRRGRAMLALGGAVLVAHLGAGVALQALGDRVLPVEPRVHIGLAPLGLLVLGEALRRRGPLPALLLGLPLLLLTLAAALTPGDLRQSQREALAELAEDSALQVILMEGNSPGAGPPPGWAGEVLPCLPSPPPAEGALWAFDHEPAEQAPPRCAGPPGWPAGWGQRALRTRPPPAQERSSSSFQPVRSAAWIGPLEGEGRGWSVQVRPAVLAQLLPAGAALAVEDVDGRPLHRLPAAGGALPPGSLSPRARVRLRAVGPGEGAPTLAQSDVLVAGLGGKLELWPDPLELPGPRAALTWARVLGGLGLLALALRRPR
jgi:hypothetical protein